MWLLQSYKEMSSKLAEDKHHIYMEDAKST
jgi:hypothetical protein